MAVEERRCPRSECGCGDVRDGPEMRMMPDRLIRVRMNDTFDMLNLGGSPHALRRGYRVAAARNKQFDNDHRGSLPFTERSWHPWSKPRGLPGCLHDVGVAMDRVLCRSLRRLETGVSECWSRSETGRTGNELRLSLSSLPEQKHVHEDDVCRSGTAEPKVRCVALLSLRARA